MDFVQWLKKFTKLSESSVYKYSHAVKTISDEMLTGKIIDKPLYEMELYEIDLAILLIFGDSNFIIKNKTGNNMYSNALKRYRCYIEATSEENSIALQEVEKVNKDISLNETERETIVKARIGQGLFRNQLFDKYKGCIITKIDLPQILIASHIKPWSVSSNKERIDVNNGLLLSATYDRLFDGGLITFLSSGEMKISSLISKENASKLDLNNKKYDILYTNKMKDYLEYHNDVVFVN